MIPNYVHFVYSTSPVLGGKQFSITHYLAVMSAYAVNKPEKIYFHYQYEPQGEWWEKVKPLLTLNKVEMPRHVFGNRIQHIAHQADVVRLRMLHKFGGVYMDLDTFCIKPYHHLLDNEMVMGKQFKRPVFYNAGAKALYKTKRLLLYPFVKLPAPGIKGLANTIVFSQPESRFLSLWMDSYKTFRGQGLEELYWDEHSVRMPYAIAQKNPDLITVLAPETFYYPFYDARGLQLLFEKVHSFPNALIFHLWESVSWKKYCQHLTPEIIKTKDTTYNLLARKYL